MKLAVLGSGFIVKEALPALKTIPEIKIEAIFARKEEVAKDFAKKYQVPKVYTDYETLLNDPEIDFVYVGLTNSVHYEYGMKALKAGKNVIMEKPFASTVKEVKAMAELALSKNLYIFEAVTLLYMPNFYAIKEQIKKIGNIKMVVANYSQYSSRYDKYKQGEVLPAFDPKLSGGALYDINIYNLNFIIALFGRPLRASYKANIGFNGIDTSGMLAMDYGDFSAFALGAKDSDSPCFITIQGDKGYVRLNGKPNELQGFEVFLQADKKVQFYDYNGKVHRMCHEFEEFNRIYADKNYDRVKEALEISITVMKTAEKARKEAGIVFGCDKE